MRKVIAATKYIERYNEIDVYTTGSNKTSYVLSKEMESAGVISEIIYHNPAGEGDAHYVDVFYENGKTLRVFKPDEVLFENDEA